MQGGEGRLNVVHLTAAQATNTGAGSTASAPSARPPPVHPASSTQGGEGRLNVVHLTAAQATNTGAGSTVSAPSARLPPVHPVPSTRETTINSSHVPMNLVRETSHITVLQSPRANTAREGSTSSAPTARPPPAHPVPSMREMTINSSHAPMNLVRETSHVTVLQSPRVNTVRENVQQATMQQYAGVQMSSSSSLSSARQAITIPPTFSPVREMNMNDGILTQSSVEEQHRPAVQKEQASSSVRKRSRMHEENVFIKEGLSRSKEDAVKIYQIDIMLQNLHAQVEQALVRGDKAKGTATRLSISESFEAIGREICYLITKNMNLQEENRAAQQQVVTIQNQMITSTKQTYMGALLQAPTMSRISSNIVPTHIPTPVRHAPAEKIIIFRAEIKGEKTTKEQQNKFRQDVHRILGEKIMHEIEVIRPTRNGGHIIIFQSAEVREEALNVLRTNEIALNITPERSCMMAPKKRFAKVVCRDPPDDVMPEEVMEDMYSKSNMYLQMVMPDDRDAKITVTRFGWIFDLSSAEAAAIQAQGARIRFGLARELLVEEYIPIQQCYNCCTFGHNAKHCQMEQSYCRLCGDVGHAGWDCPQKDNKAAWRCANCIIVNETKGTKYPTNHAAAQLHKCPCALSHRNIRKTQLTAEGIFTFPDGDNFGLENNKGEPIHTNVAQNIRGAHQMAVRKKNRSQSFQRKTFGRSQNSNRISSTSASSMTMGTTTTSTASNISSPLRNWETHRREAYLARATKPQRPRSFDAWKTMRGNNQSELTAIDSNQGVIIEEPRGRDFMYQIQGTNSVMASQMSDNDLQRPIQMMTPMYDE